MTKYLGRSGGKRPISAIGDPGWESPLAHAKPFGDGPSLPVPAMTPEEIRIATHGGDVTAFDEYERRMVGVNQPLLTPRVAEWSGKPWRIWCSCAVTADCTVHDLMHVEV